MCAIGNHDEGTAFPVNELAAALIIADKSDVRRSRVRDKGTINFDIHDRVNYAVEKSKLAVDSENKLIILNLTIDENISTMSEYFEIFSKRPKKSLAIVLISLSFLSCLSKAKATLYASFSPILY